MEVRHIWTDRDEDRDYVVPNVLSPRDLVSRPYRMDKTVPHTQKVRIPSLRGLIPELSLRKVGIGTKLEYFIIPAQCRNRGNSKHIYVSFLFFIISNHYYCYLSIYLTIE